MRHMNSIHKGVKFPCHQYDYKATRKSSLLRHISIHQSVKRNNFSRHAKSEHNNGDNIQKKIIENILEQYDELTILEDTRPSYTCHICNVNAEDLSNYRVHLNSQMHNALSFVFT